MIISSYVPTTEYIPTKEHKSCPYCEYIYYENFHNRAFENRLRLPFNNNIDLKFCIKFFKSKKIIKLINLLITDKMSGAGAGPQTADDLIYIFFKKINEPFCTLPENGHILFIFW